MKIVVLAQDDIIDGKPYVAGQRVRVADDYANVRRVVAAVDVEKRRNEESYFRIGWQKLTAILEQDYPQFWKKFNSDKYDEARAEIIDRLKKKPERLKRALNEPGWFVETVEDLVKDKDKGNNGKQNKR